MGSPHSQRRKLSALPLSKIWWLLCTQEIINVSFFCWSLVTFLPMVYCKSFVTWKVEWTHNWSRTVRRLPCRHSLRLEPGHFMTYLVTMSALMSTFKKWPQLYLKFSVLSYGNFTLPHFFALAIVCMFIFSNYLFCILLWLKSWLYLP